MTLHDLWLIIRRYYKAVIIVPIVCAVLAAGGSGILSALKDESYLASSMLTVTDATGLVGSSSTLNLVAAFAQDGVDEQEESGATVEVEVDYTTQSVLFTVQADSSDVAVEMANAIAYRAKEATQNALVEQGDSLLNAVDETEGSAGVLGDTFVSTGATAADRAAALRSCTYVVAEATPPIDEKSSGILKYGIAGFFGGLFAIVCVLALLDALRRPIKSKKDIARITQIPVLSEGFSAQSVERLWVNLGFVAIDKMLGSVCLLSVAGEACSTMGEALRGYAESHSAESSAPSVSVDVEAVQGDMDGIKAARGSDVTVLVVRSWKDKASDIVSALEELQLAKVCVAGIALV